MMPNIYTSFRFKVTRERDRWILDVVSYSYQSSPSGTVAVNEITIRQHNTWCGTQDLPDWPTWPRVDGHQPAHPPGPTYGFLCQLLEDRNWEVLRERARANSQEALVWLCGNLGIPVPADPDAPDSTPNPEPTLEIPG